jgi:hypothetical protein
VSVDAGMRAQLNWMRLINVVLFVVVVTTALNAVLTSRHQREMIGAWRLAHTTGIENCEKALRTADGNSDSDDKTRSALQAHVAPAPIVDPEGREQSPPVHRN